MENLELPNDYSIVVNNIENTVKLKFKEQKIGKLSFKGSSQLNYYINDFKAFAVELNDRLIKDEFADKLLNELAI